MIKIEIAAETAEELRTQLITLIGLQEAPAIEGVTYVWEPPVPEEKAIVPEKSET